MLMNGNLLEPEMEIEYAELPIEEISFITWQDLTILKAKDFAKIVCEGQTVELKKCGRVVRGDNLLFNEGDEFIVFDINLAISQRPVNDIRYTERISVLFTKEDKYIPWVFALRKNFPKVIHRISVPFDSPSCLCIYEERYEELKLHWRSQKFLQDIMTWLTLTANGKLHQADQALEPFIIFSMGRLILPHDLKPDRSIKIVPISKKDNRINLLGIPEENLPPNGKHLLGDSYSFIYLIGEPQEHGVIDRIPLNIFELNEFLRPSQINLFARIRVHIRGQINDPSFIYSKLVFLIKLPKKGKDPRNVENDFYAFISHLDIRSMGIVLNIWSDVGAKDLSKTGLGLILPEEAPDEEKSKSYRIDILTPSFQLSIDTARLISGGQSNVNPDINIVQIGVGALGSQVFANLIKGGFGNWKLIDADILLPHNFCRHFLTRQVGRSKSEAIAQEANFMFTTPNLVKGIWRDYLLPDDNKALTEVLTEADIILDTSASIAIARDLAQRTDLNGRRISMFLNPNGSDLVILAEDADRHWKLDILEYQYYRAISNDVNLEEHLRNPNSVRYSNACSDVTSQISQDIVAIHSGIGSASLKKLAQAKDAKIYVWSVNDEMDVKKILIPVEEYVIININGWEVYIDEYLIKKLNSARNLKLPNETGGILLGGYDFERKKIYLVDTFLSPSDSEELPTSFLRGIDGVKVILNEFDRRTAGHLMYIGEWHSHPENCDLTMSNYDILLFKEIEREMKAVGFPALMLILGDNERFEIYV